MIQKKSFHQLVEKLNLLKSVLWALEEAEKSLQKNLDENPGEDQNPIKDIQKRLAQTKNDVDSIAQKISQEIKDHEIDLRNHRERKGERKGKIV